ncbi:MAG: DUF3362 domain-containing protein, partial [Burkholderiaceae bacterium]
VTDESEIVETVRTGKIRRLHKAFLRYHDPENWEILREGLQRMGRSDLIGSSERHLVPRSSAQTAGLVAVERSRETPSPNKLAKKFGQNKPRPGGAVERRTSNAATHSRKATVTPRTGRK